ncbi:MAG TPA: hypothetical protein VNV85_00605, partial [Puia sp.]|nr:hypothetical protein [Puia sp.]
ILLKKQSTTLSQVEFPLVCLSGLSLVGVLALLFSLFISLDWKAHLIIALPALIYFFFRKNRNKINEQVIFFFKGFTIPSYCLLSGCILLILIISSYTIKHPDTLAYHCQAILWMKNYSVIPGLVNLQPHLGFQSMWFAVEAVFCPVSKNLNTSFYVNGSILCWYFIFVIGKIFEPTRQKTINEDSKDNRWFWLLLLIFTILSWTQVRLTAASASPDFIVALYIMAAVYTILNYSNYFQSDQGYLFMPVVLCSAAVAIKFSAIVILLLILPVLAKLLQKKQIGRAAIVLVIVTLTITPILIRNLISSGYPMYPSTFADFFTPDWKPDISVPVYIQHYITAYARFPVVGVYSEKSIFLTASQWIPRWWANLSIADKLLMAILAITAIINLIFLNNFLKRTKNELAILAIILLGSVLWFIKAPDPRFGTGYLLCLIYFLCKPLQERIQIRPILPIVRLYKLVTACFFILIITYSCYRLSVFFRAVDLFFPEGIEKVEYTQYSYGNIKVNLVTKANTWCGATPVPCVLSCCNNFVLRGKTINEGFKKR